MCAHVYVHVCLHLYCMIMLLRVQIHTLLLERVMHHVVFPEDKVCLQGS